jgi:hypothetical protein
MKTLLVGDRLGGVLFDVQRAVEERKQLFGTVLNEVREDASRFAVLTRLINHDLIAPKKLRENLVNMAALAVAWIGQIDAAEEALAHGDPNPRIEDSIAAGIAEATRKPYATCENAEHDRFGHRLADCTECNEWLMADIKRQLDSSAACTCNADPGHPVFVPCPIHDRTEAKR